jgi:hypothetical protein
MERNVKECNSEDKKERTAQKVMPDDVSNGSCEAWRWRMRVS